MYYEQLQALGAHYGLQKQAGLAKAAMTGKTLLPALEKYKSTLDGLINKYGYGKEVTNFVDKHPNLAGLESSRNNIRFGLNALNKTPEAFANKVLNDTNARLGRGNKPFFFQDVAEDIMPANLPGSSARRFVLQEAMATPEAAKVAKDVASNPNGVYQQSLLNTYNYMNALTRPGSTAPKVDVDNWFKSTLLPSFYRESQGL